MLKSWSKKILKLDSKIKVYIISNKCNTFHALLNKLKNHSILLSSNKYTLTTHLDLAIARFNSRCNL